MDDDKIIPEEKQPDVNRDAFQTVSQEEPVIEEAPQDMTTPNVELPPPDDQQPPVYQESNKQNMFIIG